MRFGPYAILTSVVLTLAAAPVARGADLTIDWHTIDNGGGYSAGGSFELDGTVGQPDAGVLSGGEFTLSGGFWAAAPAGGAPACPGDADGDGDVDVSDLGLLLGNYGLSGAGLGGDLDGDGDVDITDLGTLLANFGLICA